MAGSMAGPKAVPGRYTSILSRNRKTVSREFTILKNPASESSEADIQAQFDFVKSINNKVSEAHQAIIDIRALQKQIKSFKSRIAETEIKDYIGEMDSIMTSVEKNLYQTKNRSGQDPLNFPIKLTTNWLLSTL